MPIGLANQTPKTPINGTRIKKGITIEKKP